MIKILALGLTRIPRIVLLGLIALKFGVNEDTDSFFLIYSIVLFLVANIGFTAEIFSPNRKTLTFGVLCSSICLLTLAIATGSTLALLFVPYVLLSGMVSVVIGVSNLNRNYKVLTLTSTPYLATLIPILIIDMSIQGLIITLSSAELVRLVISHILIGSSQDRPQYTWQHALGMLSAVVIGASSGIVDRLFATTLAIGSVTLLSYAFGAILPLTNVLTYGVNASRIVDPNAKVPMAPCITLSIITALVTLAIFLVTDGWISQASEFAMLLSPFIILSTISSSLRSSVVYYKDWKAVLWGSILYTACNVILDYLLLGFGVRGIIFATLISHVIYIYYLKRLLKQQKYLSYNTVMSSGD